MPDEEKIKYSVECPHCDKQEQFTSEEGVPPHFRWMELASNYICDDCFPLVYRF